MFNNIYIYIILMYSFEPCNLMWHNTIFKTPFTIIYLLFRSCLTPLSASSYEGGVIGDPVWRWWHHSWHHLCRPCQDNILIELVSETIVSVVPRELLWQKPDNEEVSGKYFKVNLKPGEGIVIPSNYLHSVHWLVCKMCVFQPTNMGFYDPHWLYYPPVTEL